MLAAKFLQKDLTHLMKCGMIYEPDHKANTVTFHRTGTHSDLNI